MGLNNKQQAYINSNAIVYIAIGEDAVGANDGALYCTDVILRFYLKIIK
jgi:hypothetical protein